MSAFQQSRKEEMYEFFREPNREKLREILRGYDAEYDNLDFKKEWIDQAKLAKHVLALANSGGGVIVFGIAESEENSLSIDGLDSLMDKSDIAIDSYLPEKATDIYVVEEYAYTTSDWEDLEDKTFQVLFVEDRPRILPLISQKGAEGRIRKDEIYIRKNTKSVKAGQSEIDNIIDRRVKNQLKMESGDLRKDLAQLMTLYDFSKETGVGVGVGTGIGLSSNLFSASMPGRRADFYRFINTKISQKQKHVEERLGIS